MVKDKDKINKDSKKIYQNQKHGRQMDAMG